MDVLGAEGSLTACPFAPRVFDLVLGVSFLGKY